jgi:hypothetical protein
MVVGSVGCMFRITKVTHVLRARVDVHRSHVHCYLNTKWAVGRPHPACV